VTYSWLLVYKTYDNARKATALKDYITWCLTEGQAVNESLGFVRLPPQVVSRTVRALDNIH
jgi:phosphate transport system substrate-binding protein